MTLTDSERYLLIEALEEKKEYPGKLSTGNLVDIENLLRKLEQEDVVPNEY